MSGPVVTALGAATFTHLFHRLARERQAAGEAQSDRINAMRA
ncbi:hypothetical protein R5H32_17170 [Defluviimonas sp. D31]|nr:hypothetical protein [Defluviimonas sp. D31]MDW4551096.1 hypothetical protein [Defluviimonas sp. D31]